jgi:hypothetical protein
VSAPLRLNPRHRAALKWLRDSGGRATFNRHGVAFAKGDWRDFMRSTWEELHGAGMVDLDGGRVSLTDYGRRMAVGW